MYTAKQNFAFQGKTYKEGDKIPAKTAKELPEYLVEAPKAKTTIITQDTLEGDN